MELLFRVFVDRDERGRLLVTTNLPFSEWGQIFQGKRMTAALLDRLCHHCHIFEMNGVSYRSSAEGALASLIDLKDGMRAKLDDIGSVL